MKVLTIFGGSRLRGNTATVLGWLEEALRAHGHTVTRVNLTELSIRGCTGCWACAESMTEPACVVEDDANAVFKKMIASDGIVFASPLYMWGFSGQLKTFIDRTCCLVKAYDSPQYTSLVGDKRAALLMTCAGPIEKNAELAREQYHRYTAYTRLDSAAAWIVPNCSEPDSLSEAVRKQAEDLAEKLIA
jgi:multimeric flavodoxin WrbA